MTLLEELQHSLRESGKSIERLASEVEALESKIHSVGLLMTQAAILLSDGATWVESNPPSELSTRMADCMRAHSEQLRKATTPSDDATAGGEVESDGT